MKNLKLNSAQVLSRILQKKVAIKDVSSSIFPKLLRDHVFSSESEKDEALRAYCNIVLTKDIKNAIFIMLPENPSIKTLGLQFSIREGKSHQHIIDEFSRSPGHVLPVWYVDAEVKKDVPTRNKLNLIE